MSHTIECIHMFTALDTGLLLGGCNKIKYIHSYFCPTWAMADACAYVVHSDVLRTSLKELWLPKKFKRDISRELQSRCRVELYIMTHYV